MGLVGFPDGRSIGSTVVVIDFSHVQCNTDETTVTQRVSHRPIKSANPACGHKEVRKSTDHIIVDQQGSKS